MKLPKYVALALLSSSFVFAGETMHSATTPLAACQTLVEKAKSNDFVGYVDLSVGGTKKGGHEKKFTKMHKENMERIKNIQCVSEQIADDRAVVSATTGEKKRLIPFVSENGNWKFDAKTYMSFYGGSHHGGYGKK